MSSGVAGNPNQGSNLGEGKPSRGLDIRRRVVGLTILPALFLAVLIVSIPADFFITDLTNIPITIQVMISFVAEILVVVSAFFIARLRPMKEMLFLRVNKWWHIPIGALIGFAGYWVLQLVALATQAISGQELESSATSQALAGLTGIGGVLFLVFVVTLLAPFVEELLFRGVIIGSLRHSAWNKAWISILVSGLTFGVIHIQGFSTLTDASIFVWITVMGGIFATLVIWTKSLWTSVAAHISYNLVTTVILILQLKG